MEPIALVLTVMMVCCIFAAAFSLFGLIMMAWRVLPRIAELKYKLEEMDKSIIQIKSGQIDYEEERRLEEEIDVPPPSKKVLSAAQTREMKKQKEKEKKMLKLQEEIMKRQKEMEELEDEE